MAWGGMGGGGIGGGGGGMLPMAAGRAASPNGLPFAGIPSELQGGVDKLLAAEPERPEPTATFTHRMTEDDLSRLTLRGLITRHQGLLWAALFFVSIVSVVQQAGPYLTDLAINKGIIPHRFSIVLTLACVYIVALFVTAAAQRFQVMVTGRLAASVMNDLRVKVFTHLQRLSLDYFTAEKAGVVMTRMTSDIENLQQLLQDGLASFAVQGLTMIVITVLLFTLNVQLAFITVLLIVPILTILSLWFRSASEKGYDRVRDGIANVLGDLSESLHGVRVVTAHNRQRHNVLHHRNVVGEYRRANMYTAQINAVYGPSTQMLGFLGQGALLIIGGNMVLHHHLSLGALTAFFLYLNRFFQPIQLLVQQYNTFQQGQASIFKLRTLLTTEPSVLESEDAVDLPPVRGDIVFDDVSFGYDPLNPVVRHIDMHIFEGETVAFVGATGAGKSTLAKLVTRFYDPTEGHIYIDGHELRSVTLHSLRTQLGVVPQEPFLFAGSIRDNLAFGRPGASDEEIWEAVEAVGLTDVLDRMPLGLDTVVHERGQSLSSGERQLLALARAFLFRPRILVLDEATSNLDLQSETKIERALDMLLENRTAILIAHRLSTAMKADRIVVVSDGEIVESGSHRELLALDGMYADMFATWIRHSSGAEHGQ